MPRIPAALISLAAFAATLAIGPLAPPAGAATVLHVDASAAGFANGSSWANAFPDLQSALAIAASGDEIRVAAGTYRPATTDRTASFTPGDGVTVLGGFAPGGSAEPHPSAHLTVLSGDLAGDDLPGFVNIVDNSHHVVDVSASSGVSIAGMTIVGGNADATAASTSGGGVLADAATNLVLDTVVVRDNTAESGGGLAAIDASPIIRSSVFADNAATRGGALAIENGTAVVLGTRVTNNAASAGAGVFNDGGALTLTSSIVAFNAADIGGGIHTDGGTSTIVHTTITGNRAASGGGVYGVFATTTIANSIIHANTGAAIDDAFGASTSASSSIVEGGWPGSGVLDVDPLFVAPADVRLQPASPGRDSADNAAIPADTFDLDGDGDVAEPTPAIDHRPRLNGADADMGAHETAVAFDAFAAAGDLTGDMGSVTVSTVGATAEPGETPASCGGDPLTSIWLRYTPTSSGPVQFDTLGSSGDTVLHILTGSTVDGLTEIACNDDVLGAATADSAAVVDTVAATTYYLRIDGAGASTGAVTVNWGPASTITATGLVALEGDVGTSTWQMPVTLSAPATIPITFDWRLPTLAPNTGIAVPGVDLVDASGTVTIPAGQTSTMIDIEIIGDTDDEEPLLYGEWAVFGMENVENTRITGGLFGLGLIIIIDDD